MAYQIKTFAVTPDKLSPSPQHSHAGRLSSDLYGHMSPTPTPPTLKNCTFS